MKNKNHFKYSLLYYNYRLIRTLIYSPLDKSLNHFSKLKYILTFLVFASIKPKVSEFSFVKDLHNKIPATLSASNGYLI